MLKACPTSPQYLVYTRQACAVLLTGIGVKLAIYNPFSSPDAPSQRKLFSVSISVCFGLQLVMRPLHSGSLLKHYAPRKLLAAPRRALVVVLRLCTVGAMLGLLGAPLSPAASADRTKGARFAGGRAGCSSASVAPAPPTLQARHSMPAAWKPRESAGPPLQLLPREGPGPRPALADDDPPLISYPQTIPSPQDEPPPREVREASMTALLRADQRREAERAQRAAEGVARAQSVTFVGQCPTLTPVVA